jgi:hypothetical protein
VHHPAERVGHARVLGQLGLRLLGEIERAIQILAGLGEQIGEVVLRFAELRVEPDRLFVLLLRGRAPPS